MSLNVSVGWPADGWRNSPYGTRPVLMSAWKPLQMPRMRPSRFWMRSMTASATCGLRRTVAMNLPEPSGSSPAEKPPGIMRICDSLICWASSVRDSSTCLEVRFLKTEMVAFAPASLNILAESYSEFVPGKQGTITFGLAPVMMLADF